MYDRNFRAEKHSSFFIFGPRGTGKTSWLKFQFPKAPYFDLLDSEVIFDLQGSSLNLEKRLAKNYHGPVVIDEVQKLPQILNEVHRLIESKKGLQFILTGSSARKFRRAGVNLLAGRALVKNFYPLTTSELGEDFSLPRALKYGLLPSVWDCDQSGGANDKPTSYLKSYVQTYVDLEVKLEGLSRNVVEFSRFLSAASFSQASPLNISTIAAECGIERRTVSNYFDITRDLLISYELPVFTKKAKREMIKHQKFYFFDVGVYQVLRPKGPLDSESEINGAAFETLILQELMATNNYLDLDYQISYWHTKQHQEVDFVLYGRRGLYAIETKLTHKFRASDLAGLELFASDYPTAKLFFVYGGDRHFHHQNIEVIPVEQFLKQLPTLI
ncbi:MAG: ATP-binding protein [Oligoflexia bacterium]|nr:ATP-binding protein [Oligoflexia bacterium]